MPYEWQQDFLRARSVSTPLIALAVPDWYAAMNAIVGMVGESTPCFSLDCIRGFSALNEASKPLVGGIVPNPKMLERVKQDTGFALEMALDNLPAGSILFLLNAHLSLEKPSVIQAICLAREAFKTDTRQLVLLSTGITLPPELAMDVMLIDEPLPDDPQLEACLTTLYGQAKEQFSESLDDLGEVSRKACVDAARGLSLSNAEQAFAFSIDPKIRGIDARQVWKQKKRQVQMTPGITFWEGGETYADIGGLDHLKWWFERFADGPHPFNCIVFLDEIEKHIGGGGDYHGDGGVQQGMKGTLLSAMEDEEWGGLIAVGPPGVAKSLAARATGGNFNIPTLCLDLGATKGGIVGTSERNIRQAMKVIKGIAGKGAFWIATSNAITSVDPALLRRFELGGTWFFDLPSQEERPAIWKINLERFGLAPTIGEMPDDTDWTGANIRDCCKKAWALGIPLAEAALQIVPIAKRDPELLERLRRAAHNNWLSCSSRGTYQMPELSVAAPTSKPGGQRQFGLTR